MRKAILAVALLLLWVAADWWWPRNFSLRQFDPHAVGDLETRMWQSYYDHQRLLLFWQLTDLMRSQYRMPFWRSVAAGYHAARAAVVFQRGANRSEHERALPDLIAYYRLIRSGSDIAFRVEEAARLELEWWIVHRQRAVHRPGDLEQALALLQAELYQTQPDRFAAHAELRARAMLLRDERAANGGLTVDTWQQVAQYLDASWTSLHQAVNR